jgi:hypothetical protein
LSSAHPRSGHGFKESETPLDRASESHTAMHFGPDQVELYNGHADPDYATRVAEQLSVEDFFPGTHAGNNLPTQHSSNFSWVIQVLVLHFLFLIWNYLQ